MAASMAGESQEKLSLNCGFSDISPIYQCGLMRKYPSDVCVVLLQQCKKNIQAHLKRQDVPLLHAGVQTECELIATRCGYFDLSDPELKMKTICPIHRYRLGLSWESPRKYQHPLHPTSSKRKTFRGISATTSKQVQERWNVFMPIGTGICRGCSNGHREAITLKQHSSGIDLSQPQPGPSTFHAPPQPDSDASETDLDVQSGGPSTPESTGQAESDTSGTDSDVQPSASRTGTTCGEGFVEVSSAGHKIHSDVQTVEELSSDSDIIKTMMSPPQPSSSGSSPSPPYAMEVDASWAPTPAPRQVKLGGLNTFLQYGGYEPVEGRLLKPIEECGGSTVRLYTQKAREAINLSLNCLAPGQEEALLERVLQKEKKGVSPESELAAIVKCYEDSKSWYTKRQLLSIIAEGRTKEQLQAMIPGLTVYRIDQARKHAKDIGSGQPVSVGPIEKSRLDDVKVDHFLDFVSQPEFLQDVAYGTKTIKLSHGEKLEIPNVVRSVISSRIIDLYLGYCEETGFSSLKRSSLFSIIQVCAASQKKSLAGLDNVVSEGTDAFETLHETINTLGECGHSSSWIEDKKRRLDKAKLYLKSDYKMNVHTSSRCGDHCIPFALGGQSQCDHVHDLCCDQCEDMKSVLEEIQLAASSGIVKYKYPQQQEQVQYDIEVAKEQVMNLKSHLLRQICQEQAKTDVLDKMTPSQALLTMDWAMKFLPSRFREAQQDWYGKKGISWHVSAVITKTTDEKFEIHCFVHLVQQCTQNWFAVLSVLEATMEEMKIRFPDVNEFFLRSDNAGCYHCAPLILSIPALSSRLGIRIRQYDFSEAQAGKDICDRKIAPMKAHINRFVNEGHNVTNAVEMHAALSSYGGVRGCHVAALEVNEEAMTDRIVWPGVTKFTNFVFGDSGLEVTQGYRVGTSKFYSYDELLKKAIEPQGATDFVIVLPYSSPRVVTGTLRQISSVVTCTEVTCRKTFSTQEALFEHIALGRHTPQAGSDKTLDTITRKWATKVSDIAIHVQSTRSHQQAADEQEMSLATDAVTPGWALKSKKQSKRFALPVKDFLFEEFMRGVDTGRKENPSLVAKKIKLRFQKEDWLTMQQVSSYFSRLAAQQKCGSLKKGTADIHTDEAHELADTMITRSRQRAEIILQVDL
ncbi:uncharacterized protein LOC135493845 [Lineus longissimus]|uniref:uncharacterized protein LOC135493845 n=1 Tax=Lineus longissimus TaxID=88925 RepID=UPI002B4CE0D9